MISPSCWIASPAGRVWRSLASGVLAKPFYYSWCGTFSIGIARRLGLSRQTVWDRIGDLESLDKVRKEGGEYHIVGSLIAAWGKQGIHLSRDTI